MDPSKDIDLEVRIAKYVPYAGGCLRTQVLPLLQKSHSIISFKCKEDCFMYCVLAHLHPKSKNAERCDSSYKQYIELYDFSDVRRTVFITSITKFERKRYIR